MFGSPYLFVGLALVMWVGGFAIAVARRGKVQPIDEGDALRLHSPDDPEAVYARVRRLAELHRNYRLDDEDPQHRLLVLSSSPTFFSYGFFYPVSVVASAVGGTDVRVGIKSRFIQWGPIVSHNQKVCAGVIEKVLAAPAQNLVAR